jgi:hypothetical protein
LAVAILTTAYSKEPTPIGLLTQSRSCVQHDILTLLLEYPVLDVELLAHPDASCRSRVEAHRVEEA